MKLGLICYEYPPGPHGGVGTFTQLLARELVAAGHEVRVAGIYPPSYPAPDYEVDHGVQVWRLRESDRRLAWVYARYRLYRLVKRWIAAGDVDVVEAPDCYGWFAGWPKLPVPLVARAHGSLTYYAHELGRPVSNVGHRLEAASYRRTDAWVAVSAHAGALTQRLFDLPTGPASVLYNPVPAPERVRPYAERTPGTVVFTGTLTPKKGIVSLIDAWPTVAAALPEARLHVYGKDQRSPTGGSMQEYLRASLPEPARGSVTFHGHVNQPEVMRGLGDARVAVFPSYTETFGLCAAEAMAAGCATLYTRRTCGPEIVRDGMDGRLIDPDDRAGIAASILAVLRDEELGARLSVAGRARVLQDFALAPLMAANEQFFLGVVRKFHNGRGG